MTGMQILNQLGYGGFCSAVGKGVLGDDCLIDCSQIPMIYCNYDTQDVVDITLDDLSGGGTEINFWLFGGSGK